MRYLCLTDAHGIGEDHHEAYQRDQIGQIDAESVGHHSLERGDEGTAKDGHDQAGSADLGIAGVTALGRILHAVESKAVDGREHEGHEEADCDQGDDARPAGAAEKALYMMESNAPPRKVAVKTGLTDGSFTEIKEPADIVGQEVVLGVMPQQLAGPGPTGPSNPFMPKRPGNSRNKGGPPPR